MEYTQSNKATGEINTYEMSLLERYTIITEDKWMQKNADEVEKKCGKKAKDDYIEKYLSLYGFGQNHKFTSDEYLKKVAGIELPTCEYNSYEDRVKGLWCGN